MTLRTRTLQRVDLEFTELGFGTAPFGNLYRAISDTEADAILDLAWQGGVRYFDTAPLYGLGLAETRLNRFLRDKPRDAYLLSTKVGRLLSACPLEERTGIGKWFEVPSRVELYDYSHDGILRSMEFSLERLGVDRIDILYVHDIDIANHGSAAARDAHIDTLMSSGVQALMRLRDEGVIKAFGAGVNEWEACQILAERGDFDLFLLAGRYTLLEQEALNSFLPLCEQRGIGVVIGGPYNSGILATGTVAGAYYDYETAPAHIIDKVRQLESACASHAVPLIDAAFQFPLMHPSVVSVIPGGQSADEMRSNLSVADSVVPRALWQELKDTDLIRNDAPIDNR